MAPVAPEMPMMRRRIGRPLGASELACDSDCVICFLGVSSAVPLQIPGCLIQAERSADPGGGAAPLDQVGLQAPLDVGHVIGHQPGRALAVPVAESIVNPSMEIY